jgi:predicted NBD/HSP70 family sugar kinase
LVYYLNLSLVSVRKNFIQKLNDAMSKPIWGFDLGGTKIEGVILPSVHDPKPILRRRIDTEADKGYQHIVGQIIKLTELMKEESGLQPAALGIGTPGVLDPILLTMKNCNSTALNGQPLLKDVQSGLNIPVVLANDATVLHLPKHIGVWLKKKLPMQKWYSE